MTSTTIIIILNITSAMLSIGIVIVYYCEYYCVLVCLRFHSNTIMTHITISILSLTRIVSRIIMISVCVCVHYGSYSQYS